MTARIFCGLTLFLASCSEIESEDGGMARAWRTEVSSNAVLGTRGGLDHRHFYFEGNRDLIALDIGTGGIAWRRDVSAFCRPPLAAAERVFCPSDDLSAFDAETGRTLWAFTPDTTFQLAAGTADAMRVYSGAFRNGGFSTVYAYDASTGALAWRRRVSSPAWVGSGVRALVLDGETLFATVEGLYSENGFFSTSVIVAYEAATGRELWRFEDGDGTDSRKIGGLAVTDDALVFSSAEDGNATVALDRATREVRWRVARRPGFLGTRAAPEIADGAVYTAEGDTYLYAIDLATGALLWDVKPDRGSYRNHAICGDYFVGDNTALTVVERATGALVEVLFDGADEGVRQMVARDGRLYVATDKAAYAFDCR